MSSVNSDSFTITGVLHKHFCCPKLISANRRNLHVQYVHTVVFFLHFTYVHSFAFDYASFYSSITFEQK